MSDAHDAKTRSLTSPTHSFKNCPEDCPQDFTDCVELFCEAVLSVTEVYFIRHGIAVAHAAGADDEGRSLTQKGIAKTRRIAQRLSELNLHFDTLLTSPLVRAQQTAEILQAAGLASQIQEFLPLRPGGCIADWLTWLSEWHSAHDQLNSTNAELPENSVNPSMALVGHEPDLSRWAQRLVGGQHHDNWTLKKAGIIGLQVPAADRAIGESQLFWLSPPRFLL